jgi:apolipoprotein N-acyltransferase
LLFKDILNSRWALLWLAVLSAGLLWLGWPIKPLPFFLFVGFVPFLLMEHLISLRPHRSPGGVFFRYAYLTFFLWNAFTTWWVMHATVPGGIAAVVLNALLMCIPAMAFFYTKRAAGPAVGYFSFVVYWLSFEYLHLNWDLTWPWLTLGNGFASLPEWVQWYEYTGFMGGSLWVLLVNVLLFRALVSPPRLARRRYALPALLVAVPIVVSYVILAQYEEQGEPVEVVVVQPNVDPYNEKYTTQPAFIPYDEQLAHLIRLSESMITPDTKYVVWPETALRQDGGMWEESLEDYPTIQILKEFVQRHPGLELVTGIESHRTYPDEASASPTARNHPQVGYYDSFNTGIQVTGQGPVNIYHKSKLVPGVEKLPYPGMFKFLGGLAIDLGGTVGSLGSQAERSVFRRLREPEIGAAPVICYESIYGDYVAEYVRKGASLIFVITNDGWWSDSPGYRQHLQYATLRAIETRRSIARSANTGISAFINQKGEILQRSGWWEEAVLRDTIRSNQEQTFYTRTGEYIGTTAPWLSLGLALLAIGKGVSRKKRKVAREEPVVFK